ncbi:hypothetical protein [Micromonospora sp. DT231]|uniref:hypothetical protein n=1 Tax=Micromonospora sp. DT231 TaxID=3416526 RepID=UPI003CEAE768
MPDRSGHRSGTAIDERYAHILADLSGPNLPDAQAIAYANTGAQRIIDRAMTLEASD